MTDQLRDPRHESFRLFFRITGPAVLAVGGVCMIVAMVNFFSSGLGEPPRLFWLFFVAMPLLFFGGVLSMLGFGGAVARYQAGEMAPVGKDVVNFMAEGTQQGIRTMAQAAGSGLAAGLTEGRRQIANTCNKCGRTSDADDKFCGACGAPLDDANA
jgi:hypothetical protein